jgi:hypothetical protein
MWSVQLPLRVFKDTLLYEFTHHQVWMRVQGRREIVGQNPKKGGT